MHAADVLPRSGAGCLKPRGGRAWRVLRRAGVLVLLLCFAAQLACAFDIITTDGQLYKSCSVTQIEPDALRIIHSDGAARISYDKLPAALQKQYFDPVKVAAYREELATAKRVADEAAAAKAAAQAAEERRQRAIAAALAEEQKEQKEQEEAVRRQEKLTQEEGEQAEKSNAAAAATRRQTIERRKRSFLVGIVGLGIVLSVFVYFLPSIIGRRKVNSMAIFTLNLFLGWTFFGWVIALVWACTQDSAMEQLARERMNMPPPSPPRPYGTFGGRQVEGGRTLESGGRYLE